MDVWEQLNGLQSGSERSWRQNLPPQPSSFWEQQFTSCWISEWLLALVYGALEDKGVQPHVACGTYTKRVLPCEMREVAMTSLDLQSLACLISCNNLCVFACLLPISLQHSHTEDAQKDTKLGQMACFFFIWSNTQQQDKPGSESYMYD